MRSTVLFSYIFLILGASICLGDPEFRRHPDAHPPSHHHHHSGHVKGEREFNRAGGGSSEFEANRQSVEERVRHDDREPDGFAKEVRRVGHKSHFDVPKFSYMPDEPSVDEFNHHMGHSELAAAADKSFRSFLFKQHNGRKDKPKSKLLDEFDSKNLHKPGDSMMPFSKNAEHLKEKKQSEGESKNYHALQRNEEKRGIRDHLELSTKPSLDNGRGSGSSKSPPHWEDTHPHLGKHAHHTTHNNKFSNVDSPKEKRRTTVKKLGKKSDYAGTNENIKVEKKGEATGTKQNVPPRNIPSTKHTTKKDSSKNGHGKWMNFRLLFDDSGEVKLEVDPNNSLNIPALSRSDDKLLNEADVIDKTNIIGSSKIDSADKSNIQYTDQEPIEENSNDWNVVGKKRALENWAKRINEYGAVDYEDFPTGSDHFAKSSPNFYSMNDVEVGLGEKPNTFIHGEHKTKVRSSLAIPRTVIVDEVSYRSCQPIVCNFSCPGDLWKLSTVTGCPRCECCPTIQCSLTCENGYEADEVGCPVCKCLV